MRPVRAFHTRMRADTAARSVKCFMTHPPWLGLRTAPSAVQLLKGVMPGMPVSAAPSGEPKYKTPQDLSVCPAASDGFCLWGLDHSDLLRAGAYGTGTCNLGEKAIGKMQGAQHTLLMHDSFVHSDLPPFFRALPGSLTNRSQMLSIFYHSLHPLCNFVTMRLLQRRERLHIPTVCALLTPLSPRNAELPFSSSKSKLFPDDSHEIRYFPLP